MANWETILKTLMIEKSVPIPSAIRRPGTSDPLRAILKKMDIGDSVFLAKPDDWPDNKRYLPLFNAAKGIADMKFAQRAVEGGLRIWRTE